MDTTKAKLYRKVQATRDHLGITSLDYPLPYLPDMIAERTNIYVRETPLLTPGLRGMTVADPFTGTLAMLLDLSASKEAKQFAAAHELMHCEHHPAIKGATYQSYDTAKHRQNMYLEWEANEGAAELIMPYKYFIPFFFVGVDVHGGYIRPVVEDLAKYYEVSEATIDHRISSLKYEMWQYACGTPIDAVELLSKSQQLKRGIDMSHDTVDDFYHVWKVMRDFIA